VPQDGSHECERRGLRGLEIVDGRPERALRRASSLVASGRLNSSLRRFYFRLNVFPFMAYSRPLHGSSVILNVTLAQSGENETPYLPSWSFLHA